MAVINEATGVTAPDEKLTVERAKLPATGNEPTIEDAILAKPTPVSSWLASILSRDLLARAVPMLMLSKNTTSAIKKADGPKVLIMSKLIQGTLTSGRLLGISPTIGTVPSKPKI